MKKISGFTLIEILMVISVIAVVIPSIMSIVYVILTEQLRIYRLTETKRQGDYIANIMKEKISRDANTLFDNSTSSRICNTAGSSFSSARGTNFDFIDAKGNMFAFREVGGNMALTDFTVSPTISTNINDGKVVVSGFTIECIRKTQFTKPLIGYAFDITFLDNTPTVREGTITFHYQTKVKLR